MTRQGYRLPEGGRIDRSRTVGFSFDGKHYSGHPGDTIASALIANGVHMVARSFKYHRPRGILAAGSEDPAALVQIGTGADCDPNVRVSEQEIYDGLAAVPQNCWPSLAMDIGAAGDLAASFLPAGFYYKTFMGPRWSGWPNWMTFEPLIRRSAGLGRAPDGPDPDRYEATNRHCEVLIVGGGPAGLTAALSAARAGARVIVAEETPELGGNLLARNPERPRIDGQEPAAWIEASRAELAENPDVIVLTRTTAFGYYAQNFLGLWERVADHLPPTKRAGTLPRQRLWRVRAKEVVLATGAVERPLVFHHNDRPGIMLAGSVQTYIYRYGVLPGRRPAVFTNNDTGWETAFAMAAAGAEVMAIVDVRRDIPGRLLSEAVRRGIPIHAGAAVTDTKGHARISEVSVRSLSADGGVGRGVVRIHCDLLAVAGGYAPNAALFAQSRGTLRYDEEIAAFRPGTSWQNERSAGAANGNYSTQGALEEGAAAGAEAAAAAGYRKKSAGAPSLRGGEQGQGKVSPIPVVPSDRPPHRTRAFVDLQDDVTAKDLKLAVSEGYRSVEHAKRYTTVGMGTDQGKVANMNTFAVLAAERGEPLPAIGTTTFRQPYKPVTFGALAAQHVGRHFAPRRTTPMHRWHRDQGATFEPVGDWLRARAYPRDGENFDAAVQREAKAARTTIGVLDASTLGKIDVRGPDARELLNRIYTNAWSKLAPGRCRYGLMLGEDGMVMDDGVTACIADDHFHMTTTTGGAAGVLSHLEDYLQTEWTDLKVYLTSVTEQWAVAAISGPNAPALVGDLLDDFDPDPEQFAFMDWRDATFSGIPVRVFRISFTGEVSYEINIPATYGLWMWNTIMARGAAHGVTPYGTEAMHLLRAEKGFVIVGQETDGTVTPYDLRMDWIVKKTGDFVGKRALSRPDTARKGRRQLIGLLTQAPQTVLIEGSQIVAGKDASEPPVPMLGWVTSSYLSPNAGRSIALALLDNGGERIGETLYVSQKDGPPIPVTVTETDFLAMRDGTGAGVSDG